MLIYIDIRRTQYMLILMSTGITNLETIRAGFHALTTTLVVYLKIVN